MMKEIQIDGTGVRTSQFGLGCGRLVGRLTLRESRKLVETALELGFRHFDTAPSYGMGTSEEVLGEVLGGVPGITIATKIGPPRGNYSARVNLARKGLKPLLDALGPLKRTARRAYAPKPTAAVGRPRYDYSRDRIRSELDQSLRLLRRTCIDLYLAHEPHPDDLGRGLTDVFAELAEDGLVRSWGIGIDARSAPWRSFGSVWQSGWPGAETQYQNCPTFVFHGVLRYAPRDGAGNLLQHPAITLRSAAASRPNSLFLVSAANPRRLRELFGS